MQFPRARSRSARKAAKPSLVGFASSSRSASPVWVPPCWEELRGSPSSSAAATAELSDALPALRAGGPSRQARGQGSLPNLQTREAREAALESLESDVYAASSVSSVRSRRRCYLAVLEQFGVEPFPVDGAKLRYLGAGLKAGGYRSAQNVLSQFKVDSERAGHTFSGHELRLLADIGRSCLRGLGPPVRAQALPFEQLHRLPGGQNPWVENGPLGPRNLIICGAWWMLREIEVANLRASLAEIEPTSSPTASLTLPASKNDASAQGATRAHACICGEGPPRVDCAAHAVWGQLWLLRRRFADSFVEDRPLRDLPLFPRADGQAASKSSIVATIEHAAMLLRVPRTSPDGTRRISGHTLRPTGAQGLTRLGLDLWTVQLLGRWGSSVVQQYVAEASTTREAAHARRHLLARSLRDLSSDASQKWTAEQLKQLAADEVLKALRAWTPSLTSEIKEALLSELSRRASGTEASGSASSDDASDPQVVDAPASIDPGLPEETVSSSTTCKKHRVLVGPRDNLCAASWASFCGWKFGSSPFRDPAPGDMVCRRCWP